jgi:hypothetical protein
MSLLPFFGGTPPYGWNLTSKKMALRQCATKCLTAEIPGKSFLELSGSSACLFGLAPSLVCPHAQVQRYFPKNLGAHCRQCSKAFKGLQYAHTQNK